MRQAQRLQLRIQIAAHAAIGSQVKLLLLSDKKIPYNPFGLYGISSIYLLQIILLPQNQQYLCMSNLRERVANIAETRK